ncbi:PD-(D/E)XK nuclease family protein [Anaerobiospirillum sp. NML120449]|uniref:PD-(D/E)XK nuclease family protein n=1 Tax=Anaerobiospirillum sp. NML120449 TaxID=2932817 RepID=UPI001FF16084|nr:PD-(D/E)XK nuclease family protein [Anaerobiospirillum sp. NML120449]MCK0525825.1 PD-(D/E)XK nuclease family protein [Anaerobiospirillum sp. NML120449]
MDNNMMMQLLKDYAHARDRHEQQRVQRPCNLNLFSLFGLSTDERAHSRFIHALLSDPHHGEDLARMLVRQIQFRMLNPLVTVSLKDPEESQCLQPDNDDDAEDQSKELPGYNSPQLNATARSSCTSQPQDTQALCPSARAAATCATDTGAAAGAGAGYDGDQDSSGASLCADLASTVTQLAAASDSTVCHCPDNTVEHSRDEAVADSCQNVPGHLHSKGCPASHSIPGYLGNNVCAPSPLCNYIAPEGAVLGTAVSAAASAASPAATLSGTASASSSRVSELCEPGETENGNDILTGLYQGNDSSCHARQAACGSQDGSIAKDCSTCGAGHGQVHDQDSEQGNTHYSQADASEALTGSLKTGACICAAHEAASAQCPDHSCCSSCSSITSGRALHDAAKSCDMAPSGYARSKENTGIAGDADISASAGTGNAARGDAGNGASAVAGNAAMGDTGNSASAVAGDDDGNVRDEGRAGANLEAHFGMKFRLLGAHCEYLTCDDEGQRGFIDILIEAQVPSGRLALVIENKIYASDQPRQLARYWRGLKNQGWLNEEIVLVYITPDGHAPEQISLTGLPASVAGSTVCMSWRDDLIKWLECCPGHLSLPVRLEDCINQYKELLADMSDNNTVDPVAASFAQSLLDDRRMLGSLFDMGDVLSQVRARLMSLFWQDLSTALKSDLSTLKKTVAQPEQWLLQLEPDDSSSLPYLMDIYSSDCPCCSSLCLCIKNLPDGSRIAFKVEFYEQMYYGPVLFDAHGQQVERQFIHLTDSFASLLEYLGYTASARKTDGFINFRYLTCNLEQPHSSDSSIRRDNKDSRHIMDSGTDEPDFYRMDKSLALCLADDTRRRALAAHISGQICSDLKAMCAIPDWVTI